LPNSQLLPSKKQLAPQQNKPYRKDINSISKEQQNLYGRQLPNGKRHSPFIEQSATKKGKLSPSWGIGRVYDDLGEKQKALEFYNQSLPLSRATEDKATQALTLNNIGRVYNALGEKQKALEFFNQSLL
jgi:tetratricopeptide (TPR) repeat protein